MGTPTSARGPRTRASSTRQAALDGARDSGRGRRRRADVDYDRLVGSVAYRDIGIKVVAEGRDPDATSVRQVATSNLITVEPEDDLDEAMRLMARHQVRDSQSSRAVVSSAPSHRRTSLATPRRSKPARSSSRSRSIGWETGWRRGRVRHPRPAHPYGQSGPCPPKSASRPSSAGNERRSLHRDLLLS